MRKKRASHFRPPPLSVFRSVSSSSSFTSSHCAHIKSAKASSSQKERQKKSVFFFRSNKKLGKVLKAILVWWFPERETLFCEI